MNQDIVLVTGAARGIGRAIASRLATEPAGGIADTVGAAGAAGSGRGRSATERVLVLADVDGDAVAATAAELSASVVTHAVNVDVGDEEQVSAAFAEIARRFGPVSRLAHAAGTLSTGAVIDTTAREWDRVFAVNARGAYLVAREAGRQLRISTASDRALVMVASNAVGVPRAGMGAYAASKAAMAALVRCLGLELAPEGIRCNTVCPGSTDTEMQRAFWRDGPEHGHRAVLDGDLGAFRVGIPLGRIADPGDIAEAVAFLLSPAARHITMHDLYVDGGATLRA